MLDLKIFHYFIEVTFGAGLFINAMLFIPQIVRILQKKESRDLSLITFLGFNFIQAASVAYGYLHNAYTLMFGSILSLITCGLVTFLIIFYRVKTD